MNVGNNSPDLASLKFIKGPLTGKTFSIVKPATTIGRDPGNDIAIKDDEEISPYHVRVVWEEGSWSIEKHPQAQTVTIDQQHIRRAQLQNNTTIALGKDTAFVFLLANEAHDEDDETQRLTPHVLVSQPSSLLSSSPASQTGLIARPFGTEIASLSTMGMPTLEVSNTTTGARKTYALVRDVVNIGRDASNEIAINDRTISGLHLQIVRQGHQLILVHPHPDRERTLNGLLYEGHKIRGDESFRKPLAEGDLFRIGNEHDALITLTYHDGSGTKQDTLPPMQPIKLSDAEVTIGRMPDNTVVLPHPQVSGYHARLVREEGTYRIHDLGSTNHLYVNSQVVTNHPLKMGDEIRIGPYKLVYESTRLAQFDESKYIRLDALNLKKSGNNQVVLLNNISLSVPPRTFVALVGGSGAGKSMLLDALNGQRPAQQGTVLYNGQDYYHNLAAFSSQLGYVPQDDIVHRDLTVERALYYAAKMRLPGDFTREQIEQRIQEVLEDVEMSDRRKLLVKKLSGGQRKRVSIALELLANPSLFFLDEPTSGLDPGLDLKMMFLLRKLADKGHTILLVTHATNNINVCDYVCFLAPGGRLVYFGPPEKAKTYFGKSEFAQIYNTLEPDRENPNVIEEAEARFKLSEDYQEYVAKPIKDVPTDAVSANGHGQAKIKEIKKPQRGNPWKQFLLLCTRNMELLKNNKSNLLILLLEAPLIAILLMVLARAELGTDIFNANKIVQCTPQIFTAAGPLALPGISTQDHVISCDRVVDFLQHNANGVAYAQQKHGTNQALQDFIVPGQSGDAQRIIFLICFVAALFGCINGAREIVKEAAIYRRERIVNLGILPYMFSKIVVLGALALLQSASIVLIVQLFEPFHQGVFWPILLEVYITLALTAVAGVILGLTVSAFAPNEDTANSLLPIILIPQVIFAGSIIPLKDWASTIAATIFPIRWAMAALGSSLGLHSDKISGDRLFGDDYTYHGLLYSIYTQADATQRILLSWFALGMIIVVLTVAIGIFLKRKDIRA